jgi:multidrug resistance efflux pump
LSERKVDAANAKQYLDRIVPLRERDFVTDSDVVEARNKFHAAQAGVATALPSCGRHRMRWESSAM